MIAVPRRSLFFAAGFAVLCTVAVGAYAEGPSANFDRTLKVGGPVLIGLDTDAGFVHVTAGPVSSVHIVGHVHSQDSEAAAQVSAIAAKPPIVQAGNTLSIGQNFHPRDIAIDYDITTPRGTDLRVHTGSGEIRVDGNGGPAELTTGSGNIVAQGLADHVSLDTGAGNIDAQMDSVRDVKAQTGNGEIRLKHVNSGLWAHSGAGSIEVSGRPIAAGWRVENGSGDIILDTAGAPLTLYAVTEAGTASYDGSGFQASANSSPQELSGNVAGGGPLVHVVTGSGSIHVR